MEKKVLEIITKYNMIKSGDKIVLAVSGGPDSIFMLDILNKIKNNKEIGLNFEIVVCHLNHMIREEAEADSNYVLDYCNKNNIQCFIKKIDVKEYANKNKIGTEEAGRILRYEFYEEVLKKVSANKIAIAHNKNDKAETIIMNLLRGTAVSGLKGIEPVRDEKYVRPIIEIDRDEIENYCKINNLEPRIDKTNFDNTYTRNKIRNIVIPYIKKEFNPNIVNTMDRLSKIVTEEDQFLNKITEEIYEKIVLEEIENQIVLNLNEFNKNDKVIKRRLMLYTITKLKGNTLRNRKYTYRRYNKIV